MDFPWPTCSGYLVLRCEMPHMRRGSPQLIDCSIDSSLAHASNWGRYQNAGRLLSQSWWHVHTSVGGIQGGNSVQCGDARNSLEDQCPSNRQSGLRSRNGLWEVRERVLGGLSATRKLSQRLAKTPLPLAVGGRGKKALRFSTARKDRLPTEIHPAGQGLYSDLPPCDFLRPRHFSVDD